MLKSEILAKFAEIRTIYFENGDMAHRMELCDYLMWFFKDELRWKYEYDLKSLFPVLVKAMTLLRVSEEDTIERCRNGFLIASHDSFKEIPDLFGVAFEDNIAREYIWQIIKDILKRLFKINSTEASLHISSYFEGVWNVLDNAINIFIDQVWASGFCELCINSHGRTHLATMGNCVVFVTKKGQNIRLNLSFIKDFNFERCIELNMGKQDEDISSGKFPKRRVIGLSLTEALSLLQGAVDYWPTRTYNYSFIDFIVK